MATEGTKSTVHHKEGERLMRLLVKAAGLEPKNVSKVVVTIESKKLIQFDVTILAEEDKLKEALDAH